MTLEKTEWDTVSLDWNNVPFPENPKEDDVVNYDSFVFVFNEGEWLVTVTAYTCGDQIAN